MDGLRFHHLRALTTKKHDEVRRLGLNANDERTGDRGCGGVSRRNSKGEALQAERRGGSSQETRRGEPKTPVLYESPGRSRQGIVTDEATRTKVPDHI